MHKTPYHFLNATTITLAENDLKNYKKWMTYLGYAPATIKSYSSLLQFFFYQLSEWPATQQSIVAFNKDLHHQKYSSSYITNYITAIKKYSAYLEEHFSYKFFVSDVPIIKGVRITRDIFTQEEVTSLFSACQDYTIQGLIDQTILYLHYGCGLRSSEGINLLVNDVDLDKELIYVQPGKTYRGRYIPLQSSMIKGLAAYKRSVRDVLYPDSPHFLVRIQKPFCSEQYLNRRLKQLMKDSSIYKNASLHSLRHSIATHLVTQGMSLEDVAQFLGHKSLEATQIYVRMNAELLYGVC